MVKTVSNEPQIQIFIHKYFNAYFKNARCVHPYFCAVYLHTPQEAVSHHTHTLTANSGGCMALQNGHATTGLTTTAVNTVSSAIHSGGGVNRMQTFWKSEHQLLQFMSLAAAGQLTCVAPSFPKTRAMTPRP